MPRGSGFGVFPPPSHTHLAPHLVHGQHSADPSLGSVCAGAISDPHCCPRSTLHSLSLPPFSSFIPQASDGAPPSVIILNGLHHDLPAAQHKDRSSSRRARSLAGTGNTHRCGTGTDRTHERQEPPSPIQTYLGDVPQSHRGQDPLQVAGAGSPCVTCARGERAPHLESSGPNWRHGSPSSPPGDKPKHSGPCRPHEEKEDFGGSSLRLPPPVVLCLCCTQHLLLEETTATAAKRQGRSEILRGHAHPHIVRPQAGSPAVPSTRGCGAGARLPSVRIEGRGARSLGRL